MNKAWLLALAALSLADVRAQTNSYVVSSLIDSSQDPYLVNPWGLSRPTSSTVKDNEWWVSDNGTGYTTLYYADKSGPASLAGLVIAIPPAPGQAIGSPTGTAYNAGVGPGPGKDNFAFATLDGTISNWNANAKPATPGSGCYECHVTTATVMVDHSASGASYQGLAIATFPSSHAPAFYAANSNGGIEAFDAASFDALSLAAGAFTDPKVPASYTPAGIQAIGSRLYVAYNAQAGGGTGYVDAYSTAGKLLVRLQNGAFDQPWGMALAPANFGAMSNLLLVGNTGNGRIGAYAPGTGKFVDFLRGADGQPLSIPGLWGIAFGDGNVDSGPTNVLYFAAGGPAQTTGVFGTISASP